MDEADHARLRALAMGRKHGYVVHGAPVDTATDREAAEKWLEQRITPDRVRRALYRFGSGKSAGKSTMHGYLFFKAKGSEEYLAPRLVKMALELTWPEGFTTWQAALAIKPRKPKTKIDSYREIWVQEHLWIVVLSCLRDCWDEPVAELRSWAQAGWERGRGHLEVLFGVTALHELATSLGVGVNNYFMDFKRFHPEVVILLRIFSDLWIGVHPHGERVLGSVHAQAKGEFKTGIGPTRPFPIAAGSGIGCILAAVSTIPLTTYVHRLMALTCEGFQLSLDPAQPLLSTANLYADDLASHSSRTSSTQLQVDATIRAAAPLRLKPGHDALKASKSASQQIDANGELAPEAIFIGIGPNGADVNLASTALYTYLGKDLGPDTQLVRGGEKMDKAVTTAVALLTATGVHAAGSVDSLSGAATGIIHGCFDTASAATPAQAHHGARVDGAARTMMAKAGHRLTHARVILTHIPTSAGGHGVEPSTPSMLAPLLVTLLKTLRGRDGEEARAATESAMLATLIRMGHEIDPSVSFTNLVPSSAICQRMGDKRCIIDAGLSTCARAGVSIHPGGSASQGALGRRIHASPEGSARASRWAAHRADSCGPLLNAIAPNHHSMGLASVGISRLGDMRGEGSELLSPTTSSNPRSAGR